MFFTDILVGNSAWVDAHDELGLAAGEEIVFQNTGPNDLRVLESDTIPAVVTNIGLSLKSENDGQFKSTPEAGETTFMLSTGAGNSTVSIQTL